MSARIDLSQAVRALFDEKATRWSRGYAPGGPLVTRASAFADAVAGIVAAPARALDFGCGTGHIGEALAARGYTVDGCDLSEAMIDEGRRLFGARVTFTLLKPDWVALPYATGHFDGALASSVLEYVADPDHVLAELARVVRPGGVAALTVPDMRHPGRWLEYALSLFLSVPGVSALAALHPRIALFARFLRTSRNRFSKRVWTDRFHRAGFEVSRTASYAMLRLYVLTRRPSPGE
jgi:SAM-dependent methyltransferase